MGRSLRPAATARLLVLAVVAFSGCGRDAATLRGSPAEAVAAALGAIQAGDCEALRASAGGDFAAALEDEGCEPLLQTYEHEGGLRAFTVGRTEPDGRRPGAELVHVEVVTGHKTRNLVLRAEPLEGRWRVTKL